MKNKLMLLVFMVIFSFLAHGAAVSYTCSTGRFGDQLVCYMHARWISYEYKIPFLYRPFLHSDKLTLSTLYSATEQDLEKEDAWPTLTGKIDLDAVIDRKENKTYVIPYFPESPYELERTSRWYFDVDWKNRKFLKIIKKELTPIIPVQKLSLPDDRICVAVHMRKGGGFKADRLLNGLEERDPNARYVDVIWPLKFPPLEFYIDSIIKVSKLLKDQPLYVHIFTDDQDPVALVEKCKLAVNKPNIVFNSRLDENRHDTNVLDDFFALTQFDCLIRGDSNFSIMASKLGNYKIQISPKSAVWEENRLIITDSFVDIKGKRKR